MTSIPDIFGTMAYGPAPEAVAPAHAWLDGHDRRFGLFIGGGWVAGEGETAPGDNLIQPGLSAREVQVLRLVAAGLTNRQIPPCLP